MAGAQQKSPRQAQRDRVSSSIEARGETGGNIWLVRPPFASRDLVLSSDFQRQAFYLIEGEHSFVRIDYAESWWSGSRASPLGSSLGEARHFASASTNEGGRCEVYLDPRGTSPAAADTGANAELLYVSDHTLNANAQRVENWPRIIACIRRLLVGVSPVVERRILLELGAVRGISMRELACRLADLNPAVLRGTVAALLRKREICSDLDVAPWSMATKLRMAESP